MFPPMSYNLVPGPETCQIIIVVIFWKLLSFNCLGCQGMYLLLNLLPNVTVEQFNGSSP
jgi:hypothetical protein